MAIGSYKPIVPFRFFTQTVIPLVYTQSLSYLEMVGKIAEKLNETIDSYNELIGHYNSLDELLKQFQASINDQNTKIAELQKQVQDEIDSLNAEFENLKNQNQSQIDAAVQEMEAKINQAQADLENLINTSLADMQKQIDDAIASIDLNNKEIMAQVNKTLDEFLKNLPDVQDVLVNDPVSGHTVTISVALQNMFDRLNTNVEMRSPQTGEIVPVSTVIMANYSMLMESGAYTCEEWDSMNSCTCDQYDTKQETAYNNDWLSNQIYKEYEVEENGGN